MPVLNRSALSASPLADLHLIASELGLDGYRRLRKAELIDRIIERQGGGGSAAGSDSDSDSGSGDSPREEHAGERSGTQRRSRRGGRGRRRDADSDAGAADSADDRADKSEAAPTPPPVRREDAGKREDASKAEQSEDRTIEGVVSLQSGGSGFVRCDGSDQDVYISGAQVRRCELVDGDRVSGPVRDPRRSERHPSLIRVDTINGRPADEVAGGTPFDELPCELPSVRFGFPGDDVTLAAISAQTPFGRGSRVTICGPVHAGKSEILRRVAAALTGEDGVEVVAVLAGIRPEEVGGWRAAGVEPQAFAGLSASPEARASLVERAIDTGRRMAVRGQDVVVVVDSMGGVDPAVVRRAMGSARNLTDSGSLTVIATAATPLGGETTLITLDPKLARAGTFPAIDTDRSSTLRVDLLV